MLSVVDLLDAGTVDLDMAAYLAAAVSGGRSLLTGAVPGGAGKTAVMVALLNFLPPDVPIVPAESSRVVRAGLRPDAPVACYLCHEIGSGGYYAYLWGKDARDYFSLTRNDHTIATNLHADTWSQAHDQLCHTNGVDEADFRRVGLMAFIAFADPGWRRQRRVAAVWESDGRTAHRMIWRWDRERDAYEQTADALIAPAQVEPFRGLIERLKRDGMRTIEAVRRSVVEFLDSGLSG